MSMRICQDCGEVWDDEAGIGRCQYKEKPNSKKFMPEFGKVISNFTKKKRSAFTIEIHDINYLVKFHSNPPHVVCVIEEQDFDDDYRIKKERVVGVAVCSPEDVFVEEEGQVVAFEKALNQLIGRNKERTNTAIKKMIDKNSYIKSSLSVRFNKFIRKNR
jgi:hypothetical protein